MIARLTDTNSGRNKPSKGEAYFRCFGNRNLAVLLSRVQGLIIRSGTELEKIILSKVNVINDLDVYLHQATHEGVFVVPKRIIKKSSIVQFDGVEPDFMVFVEHGTGKACHIVELKDGCEFDTKSSAAEFESVQKFIQTNAQNLPYTFEGHICCFNEQARGNIVKGFKNKISVEHALTGREFCELLRIDYDEIVEARAKDRDANYEYFLRSLIMDQDVAKRLKSLLSQD